MTSSGTPAEFDPRRHVREYRRVCNECGTLWHSLESREAQIEQEATKARNAEYGHACCGQPGASRAARALSQSRQDELSRIRSCPKCGSGNCVQDTIIYEKHA